MLNRVDHVIAARKRIVNSDAPPVWGHTWNTSLGDELVARYPLAVEDEIVGAQFLLVGMPNAPGTQFRLGILMHGCVCRLDCTDETHANSPALAGDDVPPIVSGPHYHSWDKNRRFFRGLSTAPQLRNAAPYVGAISFDSALRWFCAETNIEPLPHDHRLQLPLRTRLI